MAPLGGARGCPRLAAAAALAAALAAAPLAAAAVQRTAGGPSALLAKPFAKDYPVDEAPPVNKHHTFDHPFPVVQDSEDYDADFVKDENKDNGEWQSQTAYDELRHKLDPLQRRVDAAKQLHKEAGERLEALRKELEKLEEQRRIEEAKEQVADKHGDRYSDIETDWAKKAEKKKAEIEEAKKCLERLEAELKALEAKRDAAHQESSDAKVAEGQADAAEKLKSKEERDKEAEIAKAQQAYDQAGAALEQRRKELEKMRHDFEAAQNNLRKLRQDEDPQGGTFPVRSAAAGRGSWPLAALAGLLALRG